MTKANSAPTRRRASMGMIARTVFALAIGVVLLFDAGCSHERQVAAPVLPVPLVSKIPLKVGVYYTPEFRKPHRVDGTVWNIGDSSMALFNSALGAIFDQAVPVDRWPPGANRPGVAGVVIPSVIAADAFGGQGGIRYKVELFSPAGDRVASWEIAGYSTGGHSILPSKEEELMRDAIRAAGAELIGSFFREPQVRAWLVANGVSPDGEQRAVAPSPVAAGEAVTVVGLAGVTDKPVDCVAGELRASLSAMRVIPPKEFRESMYPWFEPRLAPKDTESLQKLMLQRKVKERVDEMRLHYIVTISGGTSVSFPKDNSSYFWIVLSNTEMTELSAGILDMKLVRRVGRMKAEASGGTGGGVVLFVPFGYSFSSMKAACRAIAERVVAYLTGKPQAAPANPQPKN